MKNSILGVLAGMAAMYLLVAPARMDKSPEMNTCHATCLCIVDSAERQYVYAEEIEALIRQNGLWPDGKTMDQISLQAIENCVQAHPMIRRAECYALNNQSIMIRVTQRIPLLKVITPLETYFVDTDHHLMPSNTRIKDEVLNVTGAVGQDAACNELAKVTEWLNNQSFWNEKIVRIDLPIPGRMVLYERDKKLRIEVGTYADYARNLKKLRTFYRSGLDETQYSEIDLRFRGQIIGRKNM